MHQTRIAITYMELRTADPLIVPAKERPNYKLRQATEINPKFGFFLYSSVGAQWNWTLRRKWTDRDWDAYLSLREIEIWVAYVGCKTAGYFELSSSQTINATHGETGVQVVQFGLFPNFIGRRLGGFLLCDAVLRGREVGDGRIWLHTCTRDHPHALLNYKARGFREYKKEY